MFWSSTVTARVNFRLKFSYISKMFYQTFSLNQNFYNPKLFLQENDNYSALPAVNSRHLELFSDCRTSLISLAIFFLPLGLIVLCLLKRKADSQSTIIWAATRENLSSIFPEKRDSNQPAQAQVLVRKLKFRL